MKFFKYFTPLFLLIQSFGNFSFSQGCQNFDKRIIIIGDAGRLYNGKSIVVDAIAKHVPVTDTNTTVIFAGDNIYPRGLPETGHPNYDSSVEVLEAQLHPFKGHEAKVIMIPGNHDWQKAGPEGWEYVVRQGKWVNGLGQENISYLPESGCPGPEEIYLADRIVMVIVDTQWWLHPFEKPELTSDCSCKTKEEVLSSIEDIAYRNRDNKIIFVTHHPFRSYGVHGGYYTFKQHIFPLTELNHKSYIPLPVIGSIYPISRGIFGNIQDIPHPENKLMVKEIENALSVAKDVTFVAGHDHSLQIICDKDHEYLVSGSGINRERVKKGKNTIFASDSRGFAEILFFKDGSQKTLLYEVTEEKQNLLFAYDHKNPGNKTSTATNVTPQNLGDNITTSIAPEYDAVGKFHRFLFGENYRKIWSTPVNTKVFYLGSDKRGFSIVKKGGGMQTKSLRLSDSTGKEWVLRTIQKDPERALPYNLRQTIAKKILQDQISSAHPYAPVTIPPLAKALNIPHAKPEIVYVAEDPALGIYNRDFANTICLLEEREPVDSKKTYSTLKVLEKLEESHHNLIDQRAVLKARMLDLLIGDWDRHEDQWRWERREEGNKTIYSPIPRDRDQVYFINSGLIPSIASRKWLMPKIQGFDTKIRDVNGFMFNSRYFDRLFLNGLEKKDWIAITNEIQEAITDEVIHKAVERLPEPIFEKTGASIIQKLISRRNTLQEEALKYYYFLSKNVDIPFSDKKEIFEIRNEDRHQLTLIVKKNEDNLNEDILFKRTFNASETKEIRIYGRGGKDVFSVSGYPKTKIKTRMVGGGGKDSTYVDSSVKAKRQLLVYDRNDAGNAYPSASQVVLKLSENSSVNKYNPRSFQYDVLVPQAGLALNVDDGLILGGGFQYVKHSFRKEPFAARHKFLMGHSLATNASFIRYSGDFTQVMGKNDLNIFIDSRAPANTSNFFGIGNETEFNKNISDPPIRFYRTRYNLVNAHIHLERRLGRFVRFYGGINGQYYFLSEEENRGRIIETYGQTEDEDVYSTQFFAGLSGGFEIDTRNNPIFPTTGIYWVSNISGLQGIKNQDNRLGQLNTELSIYASFRSNPKIVIANKIGAGTTMGNPAFYQMMFLGGAQNLRGYRNFRFAGNQMFFHNLEVRAKLFDFASFLFPGSVGFIGFNDIGRVWAKAELSTKWHNGYGGGLYIIPAQMLLFNALVGFSEEGILPYASLGLRF